MGYLVRTVRQPRWPGSSPITAEMRASARKDFTLREKDHDGLSVYYVDRLDEVDRIVAAVACDRLDGRDDNVDVLVFPDDYLDGLGAASESDGSSSVPELARQHRSLAWTQAALDSLVDRLLDRGCAAERYVRQRVRRCVLALRDDQIDDPTVRSWIAESRPKWVADANAAAKKRP